ncbi:hypothetical protein PSTG_05903 [Puccinia striiformis f. sp. tritici PST-78]|uniref:Uncharacterized protein n=1 Tax=Puccinia striiformis f. sp. tritici PST-78 TaxID=1165861 RepID=A0A0L0VNA7_9BASI|nr:hypothetical protein PSTG_05903 [Puccinia striiformis f. sp. tritici PST-78]
MCIYERRERLRLKEDYKPDKNMMNDWLFEIDKIISMSIQSLVSDLDTNKPPFLVLVWFGEYRYRDHCRIYRITLQRLQFLRRSLSLIIINSPKQKMKTTFW